MFIQTDSFADAYQQLRKQLLDAPLVSPRGLQTKELLGVQIHLTNSRNRLGYHPERGYSLPLYVAESIQLFSSSDAVAPLEFINPRFKRFTDDGYRLHGHYGSRIFQNIPNVIKKLKDDPDTRQAVLPIIREYDLKVKTADFPCTQVLQLLLRDKKLHMFTMMRSNDFVWGLPYDLPVFTTFQEILANTLEVEVGEYWHSASSLHIYDYHFELLERIEEINPIEFSLDYTLKDMPSFVYALEKLKEYINSGILFDEVMFDDTLFDHVLKSVVYKKMKYPYEYIPVTQYEWADQFLKY